MATLSAIRNSCLKKFKAAKFVMKKFSVLLDLAALAGSTSGVKYLFVIPLLLSGCVSLNTSLPNIDSVALQKEQASQEKAAFDEIERLRSRLDKVAHKVLSANADLCEKTAPDHGLRSQTIKSFPKELRDGARRELGLGDEPVIVFVRPGSAAQSAGLRKGDQLFGENNEPLSAPSKALNRHITEGMEMVRMRQSNREPVILDGGESCYYPAVLRMSPSINAFANGRTIVVTAGMMNFVESDDELAYIIGHELAHNTQSHIRKSITNYVLSLGGTRYTRIFEQEADYVGLYYMVRAGYDPSKVEDLWRRLALQSLRPIGRAKTHPAYPSRSVQIEATRAEIEAKRAAGDVLIPEPKTDD